ncbi:MAG: Asp-tRNA(Asn)/Glu-tRNA(Gln) amidotransferase subunit GatA [Deltaproteobacteria bacterium]|nr:Asp-tRNA(Asn)/Glu-tRNA(Gln) amidotransferase subunit GatA [Deltaproteobacteria bacterium]
MSVFDSIEQARQALDRHEISAAELTEHYLRRVQALDSQLGCFLHLDRQGALEQAELIDRSLAANRSAGRLAGIPLALKDILVTADQPTTCGSKVLEGWRASYDATVVERLRASGAVVLGKLNMDEFAMGSSNENSAYFPCKNPWDLRCVPGGSSGGSAAAVAADFCLGTLGTDTGGSIRQPASFCGVTGIKPTYGRVSRFGVIAFASSLDQVGPLARSVEDCAELLAVIAGHDPQDATTIEQPLEDYRQACRQPISGLRIGVPREVFSAGADPAVCDAVERALAELEQAGAILVEVGFPDMSRAVATYYVICTAEASSNLARYDGVRYGQRIGEDDGLLAMYQQTRRLLGAEVQRRILLGTFALSAGYYEAYYAKAQRVRTLIRRDFSDAFAACDVIATPTSPTAAFELGEKIDDPLQMYLADVFTISANLAGLPGISLPCGFSARGLPIGLQLLAKPLGEGELLRCGAAYQRLTDWHRRRPENLESDGVSR